MKTFTNIPKDQQGLNQNATVTFFDQYYNKPLQLDHNGTLAIKSFFEKRGFESTSAESIAIVIMSQAKRDNLNPVKIIDTLSGLDTVTVSRLVTEILNFNRFKTSGLGITSTPVPADEIQRNILA